MSGMGGRADKRIVATILYISKYPALTVPQAIRACKFSDKESKNAGKQMAVRRARDKAMAGKKRAFPPNVIDASTAGKTSVSPLTTAVTCDTTPSTPTMPGSTMSPTRSSSRLMKQKPKPKLIRRQELTGDAMLETYLGRYAALQKRNAVAATLDFTNEEWDSLKRMREADSCEGTNIDLADDTGNNVGALGAEKGVNGAELIVEAV